VFDLFHEGHKRLLERAKALGDYLIVGVTTEQYAYHRGKYCVADPLEKRLDNVRNMPCVDEVIIEDHDGQKAEDIEKYGIDIFTIGDDWYEKFDYLRSLCQVIYLKRTPNISSSALRGKGNSPVRLGLIGCGRVAGRFMQEAGYVRGVQPAFLYHPHPDSSGTLQRFLAEHTAIAKVRTLEKLFDMSDAVYIATPHASHYEYAKAALLAGKHVLCEKPMTLSGSQAQELFRIAEEAGVVLMEALKTAYCPGFLHLISLARSGIIGEIYDVESCFTRLTPRPCREWDDPVCAGSFTEFGSYVLLPVVKLLGTKVLNWQFQSVLNEDKVDGYTKVIFSCNGKQASVKTGLGVKSAGELTISGTKGYIRVCAPWWKTRIFEVHREDPYDIQVFSDDYLGYGLRYEIADFLYRIRGLSGRDYKLMPEESVSMAAIMEDFLRWRRAQ
jgi:glycerol-3-phosphate cytidylyltransferase